MVKVLLSSLERETIRKHRVFSCISANDCQAVVTVDAAIEEMLEDGYFPVINAGSTEIIWM